MCPKVKQYLDVEESHVKGFGRSKEGKAKGKKDISKGDFDALTSGMGKAKMVDDARRGSACFISFQGAPLYMSCSRDEAG